MLLDEYQRAARDCSRWPTAPAAAVATAAASSPTQVSTSFAAAASQSRLSGAIASPTSVTLLPRRSGIGFRRLVGGAVFDVSRSSARRARSRAVATATAGASATRAVAATTTAAEAARGERAAATAPDVWSSSVATVSRVCTRHPRLGLRRLWSALCRAHLRAIATATAGTLLS